MSLKPNPPKKARIRLKITAICFSSIKIVEIFFCVNIMDSAVLCMCIVLFYTPQLHIYIVFMFTDFTEIFSLFITNYLHKVSLNCVNPCNLGVLMKCKNYRPAADRIFVK